MEIDISNGNATAITIAHGISLSVDSYGINTFGESKVEIHHILP